MELKIPPLLLLILFASLMWLLTFVSPEFMFSFTYGTLLSVILGVLGIAIALAGVFEFRAQQTTVDPTQPAKCSELVTSGIYRFTRNPMYLGFLLMLAGWAVYLSHLWVWLALPLFVLYLNRFQIQPEERVLREIFPETFALYQQSTRRWI